MWSFPLSGVMLHLMTYEIKLFFPDERMWNHTICETTLEVRHKILCYNILSIICYFHYNVGMGYSIWDPEGGGRNWNIYIFFAVSSPHILFFLWPPPILLSGTLHILFYGRPPCPMFYFCRGPLPHIFISGFHSAFLSSLNRPIHHTISSPETHIALPMSLILRGMKILNVTEIYTLLKILRTLGCTLYMHVYSAHPPHND